MYDFYPEIEPYNKGMLKLDSIHTMYWEESGNPNGVPVLFLHGGPGAGASPAVRRFFDPSYYRIVVFDQRGCGRSTPNGECRDNTTVLLIQDIEKLRNLLNIDSWYVFGGSWGSTLALAYGETHPDRCLGFALRGIFLCTQSEIDWYLHGIKTFYPDVWGELFNMLPESERIDSPEYILKNLYNKLMSTDENVHMPVAKAWSKFEASCCTLLPNAKFIAESLEDKGAYAIARIEAHYFVNDTFFLDDALIKNIDKIKNHKAVIVQGRYDMVCPIVTADRLVKAWPNAKYVVVDDAGHSGFEPGIKSALIEAMNNFKS